MLKQHTRNPLTNADRPLGYLVIAAVACLPAVAFGQIFGGKSTIIKNVTIAGSETDGPVDLMIQGKRIARVGKDLKGQLFTPVVDATGLTVTPGLIDTWSGLGRLGDGGQPDSLATAWDNFDRYDRDSFRQALSQGVTTIYLAPAGGPGIRGTGAVIDLVPGAKGSAGELIHDDQFLSIDLGSGQSAMRRLGSLSGIRKAFRKAKDYREALETYEEELEEYLEELEKRQKENKDAEKDGEKEDKSKDKPKKGKPKKDKKEKPQEDKPKEEDKPEKNMTNTGRALSASLGDDESAAPRNKGGKKKPGKNSKGKKGDEKKDEEEDELKKPDRPKPDRISDTLLRAMDRELMVRIEAHRSADILNALELAEEFGLKIHIVGGTEAGTVATSLAEADVPVILANMERSHVYRNDQYRRHDERTAEKLEAAGVKWTMASGGNPMSARYVGFQAQTLVGRNRVEATWLDLLTHRAASLLKLPRRGRVSPGFRADLVLWRGDPNDPGARVERVYVGGKMAYMSDKLKGGAGS